MLNPSASSPAASDSQRDRLFPLLLLLFIGSGTAALTYEIVWLQWLQLIVGSTSVSLAILLAIFMGVMCLGSLARHMDEDDAKVPTIVDTLIDTLRTPSEAVQQSVCGCLSPLLARFPSVRDGAPRYVAPVLRQLSEGESNPSLARPGQARLGPVGSPGVFL